MKAVVTDGDGPILAEVAQDAAKVVEAYGEVISSDLSDAHREIVRGQMSESRLAHKKLAALSTAYNS